MKEKLDRYRIVWVAPLCAWLILLLTLLFFPVAFSACRSGSFLCHCWYFLSQSGGVYGTPVLLILFGICLSHPLKKMRNRLAVIGLNFLLLAVSLGLLAGVNEYVLKPLTHIPRPSHRYLAAPGKEIIRLPELYARIGESGREYLREQTDKYNDRLRNLPPEVIKEWTSEAGYSFPSGHSQNVFLFATLIGYLIFELTGSRRKWIIALPFAWAILVCLSRVALGVHSAYDVTAGAFQGILLALLIVFSGLYERFYFKKIRNSQ